MKRQVLSPALAVCACLVLVFASAAKSQAQVAAAEKLQKLAQVLNLSPQQKSQLAPILEAEAPKLKAIQDNPALSSKEKKKQLKDVHDEADPLVKTILNPTQYEQWKTIRKDEIEQMK